MHYKNGEDILPAKLLQELQRYVQGELLYIPKNGDQRAGWGERNGTRKMIAERNREIYDLYQEGASVLELSTQYNLSEDSIRKILLKLRKCS